MRFKQILDEEVAKEFEFLSEIIGEIGDKSIENIIRDIIFYDNSFLKKIPIKRIIKKHRPEFKI